MNWRAAVRPHRAEGQNHLHGAALPSGRRAGYLIRPALASPDLHGSTLASPVRGLLQHPRLAQATTPMRTACQSPHGPEPSRAQQSCRRLTSSARQDDFVHASSYNRDHAVLICCWFLPCPPRLRFSVRRRRPGRYRPGASRARHPRPRHRARYPQRHQARQLRARAELHAAPRYAGQPAQDD